MHPLKGGWAAGLTPAWLKPSLHRNIAIFAGCEVAPRLY
jgi:hypothetical protein